MLKSLTEIGKKICFSTKSAADLQFSDPVVALQKYLAIPLFKSDEKPFQPTMEIMKNAQKLFHPQYNSSIQFLRGAIYSRDYPQTSVPEVAFLGQSNAGKSSLIKALFHQVPNIIVKISKTPGHTKTINFFQVGNSFNLIDMPGYGMNQPKLFTEAVQGYLQERTNLNQCFLLIDGTSGITALDFKAIDMLEQYEKSFCFVITKIDIATKSVVLKNLIEFINIRRKYSSPHCYPQPFLISSVTTEGIAFLQAFIVHVTKHPGIPSEYVSLNIGNFS